MGGCCNYFAKTIVISQKFVYNMLVEKRFLVIPFILLLLLTTIFFVGRAPVDAQNAQPLDSKYFDETGHNLTGEFLRKYLEATDALLVYGAPITEAFYSPLTNRLTQYFQNARFELIPENPPELRVRVTPLGEILHAYQPGDPFNIPMVFSGCRYFPETGFSVCYSFLDFFERNGGVRVFGYPISNLETQDGFIVQYFQLARLEWHGGGGNRGYVHVSNLGKRYFDLAGEDKRLLAAVLPLAPMGNAAPQVIHTLQLRGFASQAVVPSSGVETIYVLVQDQNSLPVSNAEVSINVKLPGGEEIPSPFPLPSNKNGVVKFVFPYQTTQVGLAIVELQARYDTLVVNSVTSFRVWK